MRTTPHYGLGRIESVDERDEHFPLRLLLEADEYPDRTEGVQMWDQSPVLDQGATGTCVGHAWAHYGADGPLVNADVDPIDIYVRATELDPWPENDPFTDRGGTVQVDLNFGTSTRAGAKAMRERGVIDSYWWATDVSTIVKALLNAGPVVVGTDWYESMFRVDRDGAMWRAGDVLGGHAYLLNGVDTEQRRVRVKNSWGNRWGRNGNAWLYLWDLEYLLDGGEAVLAVETDPDVVLDEEPSGNATTKEWYAYRLIQGYTENELEGVGRNDLRDKFTKYD